MVHRESVQLGGGGGGRKSSFNGDSFVSIKEIKGQMNLDRYIDGLQPIPRDSINKGMAAMLVEQINKSFGETVYDHQHGSDGVT